MRYLIWLFLILLVVFRFFSTRPIYQNGQRVRITNKVTSEPIRYSNSQRVTLSGLKFYLPLYPEVYYGDIIVVEGEVDKDELNSAVLIKIQQSGGGLSNLRKRLVSFYQKSLSEPHSSLIAGVTIGSKASIPKNFWESLKKTSTAHVVVASGMNVTLVAGFLMNMLVVFMPRRKAIIAALVGIWFYAVISGFDAPIIRAAIMGSIAFTAQGLGRLNDAWRGLFLSALAMLVVKPDWITDLGFILSFVATASLMLFERRIRKKLAKVPAIIREDLSTSLAAQIGVAPLLFATFGQFSILSPIINALVLWTIAPITMIGMLAGMVSFASIYLGKLILMMSYPLSLWFIGVVEFFG